ncbi:MAG: hypothetical protein K2K25_06485 [Muribaculaceae bacterium]|nr:hypothetical protein [Muribaculaceae bacterium]
MRKKFDLFWFLLALGLTLSTSGCKHESAKPIQQSREIVKPKPSEGLRYLPEDRRQHLLDSVKISTDKIVDLGLSVNWAGYNVGAKKPEQFGGLYRYGDPLDVRYKESDDFLPEENIIGTEYDAATKFWGAPWRTPSKAEAKELLDKCLLKDTKYRGVRGTKIVGPSLKAIFLPDAGIMYNYGRSYPGNAAVYQLGECIIHKNYYTNDTVADAFVLNLSQPVVDVDHDYWGHSLRAVIDK